MLSLEEFESELRTNPEWVEDLAGFLEDGNSLENPEDLEAAYDSYAAMFEEPSPGELGKKEVEFNQKLVIYVIDVTA